MMINIKTRDGKKEEAETCLLLNSFLARPDSMYWKTYVITLNRTLAIQN